MPLLKKISLFFIILLAGLASRAAIDSIKVYSPYNTICADSCKGFAIVEVFSSTSIGAFRVVWKGNNLPGGTEIDTTLTTDTIFNLCPGDYTVEVEDTSDNSKTAPVLITIVNANKISPVIGFVKPTCHDSLNGSIGVSFVNFAAFPIHFKWSTGINDTLSGIAGLGKGVYGLTITDDNGCVFSDSFKLAGPDSLQVNIGSIDVTCKGLCDGIAYTNPSGGTPDYSYLWTNGDTNQSLSNLCPGKFIVTVTDSNGCLTTDSILVSEPDSVLSVFSVVDPSCNGNCDGEVTALSTGGVRPFTYNWSGYNDNDSVLNNACAGLITATVTDANGCYYTENINVNEPAALAIQTTINASTCGICDGDINVAVTGGSGLYHYLWIGQKAEDTISSIDSLCPGIYRLAVTDFSGCSDTFNIALSDDTSGIKDMTFTLSDASCKDVCDGSILAKPLGGISPYSYSWSPGGQTDSVLTGLCAGIYSLKVTDGSGCIRIEEISLEAESNLSATYTTSYIGCAGECGGEINLIVTNGAAPYSYSWMGSTSTGSNASNLCAGSYSVKVTDDNGCVFRDTVSISDPDTIGINLILSDASCFDQCDASASVSIVSGVGPFQYNWSNGESTSSIGKLCAGNHWVEITDALGCVKHYDFSISQPDEIMANALITDADCGINDGKIKLIPTGGTGPYSYCWFNQTLNDSVSGLFASASPYTVEITDANGCKKNDEFIITSKNGPVISVNVTDISCPGACDGIIEITTSAQVFHYTLNPLGLIDSSINVFGGLCPGSYYAGIQTTDGCVVVEEVVINDPPLIQVSYDILNPSCFNSCDASITANISGGLPPYSINWSNGSSLKNISSLCSGTYTLNVSDASGCSISEDVVIENPAEIKVSLSASNLKCFDVCDGRITSSVSGGQGPYTYAWSNGGNAKTADNLCEGVYWLQITDVNGCLGFDTIALGNGIPITAAFTSVNADCGQCNGSITVLAGAGNGQPYSYSWSTGDTTTTAVNLSASIYTVTISDNAGCSQEFKTTLNNVGGPALSDTTYGLSCFESCDASAKTTATTATPPYFFQWNDALMQTGDSASNLCEGIYYYSVTDSNGCTSYDSVIISDPEEIIVSVSTIGISCPGASDGEIHLAITGGQGPNTYLWSNGDTLDFIDSLVQGIYSVIVTDSLGCSAYDTINLTDPSGLSVSFEVTDASCFGLCNGVVKSLVSGGSGPYSYLWNDPGSQSTNIAAGLCAGYVTLTVTDSKGCQLIDSALVLSPAAISASPTLSNPTCEDGSNGSISLLLSGGVSPYQVSWNNGMNGTNINGLTEGNYSVTIIDLNQCVFQDSYMLNDPATPLNLNVTVTDAVCGQGNGSASAIASNGSGSYTFQWNTIPGKTGAVASGLWPNKYEVTVTDGVTGCTKTKEFIVNDAGGPTLTFNITDQTCDSLGSIHVSPGAGKFTFLWDDALQQTDSIALNLVAGLYTVRVEDTVTGCVTIDTARVGTPNEVTATLQGIKNLNCFGDCDGEATIAVKNGTPPFNYSWNTTPGQLTPTASNLCSGHYIGTVVDTMGCSDQVALQIIDPDSIVINLTIINHAICVSTCTGRARIAISGGSSPYEIYWNGSRGSDVITDLCPGTNSVEVIDFNGCSKVMSFDIMDASPIVDNAIVSLPGCSEYNGSISLNPSGGNGPYFYSWSNGASTSVISDLFAGVYVVTITDVNGCSEEFSYFLNNPNAPALLFDKNTVKCNGDCNGVARVTPSGGVAPYAYIWNHVPVSTLDSLTDLCSGAYFVKVTDATGCIAFGADTITEPPVLEGTLTKITDGCGGFCQGEAMMIAQGGTLPYSYLWNSTPPQTTSTATGLCSGMAVVILTDNNDCEIIDSVDIVPPPELVIDSTTILDATCFTNSDGEAVVYHSGGTNPIRYNWSDGQQSQAASALKNGLISIVVSDTNGCTAYDTVTINVQDTVLISAFVDSFVCIGNQTLLYAEGQGATIFQWFSDSSGTLKPIASGDSIYYTVEDSITIYLRGENNVSPPCYDIDTAYIIGIPPPQIVASSAQTTIEEGESTELIASPFLFNGSYAWSPSEGLNDTTSIAPVAFPKETTVYTVIGTNEYGCSGSDTIEIVVVKDNSIINGFSPNGDGVNDTWEIPSLKDYPDVIVEIYNRWGVQVFRSNGYREPWDGKYKGQILPNASYYFVIDYNGDGEKVATGAVTILY